MNETLPQYLDMDKSWTHPDNWVSRLNVSLDGEDVTDGCVAFFAGPEGWVKLLANRGGVVLFDSLSRSGHLLTGYAKGHVEVSLKDE